MNSSRPWSRGTLLSLSLGAISRFLLLDVGAASPGERVAAYGHVSPGEGVVRLAVPYYAGAPQVVSGLKVREGDRITKNQSLAVTNNRPLAEADVAAAKAHLAAAQERLKAVNAGLKAGQIAAQEAEIKSLQAEARAAKAAKHAGEKVAETTAHEQSLDWKVTMGERTLEAMRELRPTDVALAQVEISEAEAAVARAEALLRATEIVSPIDGQILKILAAVGEVAGAGLVEMGETQSMRIKAELSVKDARRVQPGARAQIKSEAWSGEITGKVIAIRPRVERSVLSVPSTFSNVERIVVEATIQPETQEKLAGLTDAEVTVLIEVGPAAP